MQNKKVGGNTLESEVVLMESEESKDEPDECVSSIHSPHTFESASCEKDFEFVMVKNEQEDDDSYCEQGFSVPDTQISVHDGGSTCSKGGTTRFGE